MFLLVETLSSPFEQIDAPQGERPRNCPYAKMVPLYPRKHSSKIGAPIWRQDQLPAPQLQCDCVLGFNCGVLTINDTLISNIPIPISETWDFLVMCRFQAFWTLQLSLVKDFLLPTAWRENAILMRRTHVFFWFVTVQNGRWGKHGNKKTPSTKNKSWLRNKKTQNEDTSHIGCTSNMPQKNKSYPQAMPKVHVACWFV